VGGDGHVRGGVGDAGQHESVAGLVVVQEGLVALVGRSALNLSGTAGASSGAAAVRQVQAGLLCCVEDVGVPCMNGSPTLSSVSGLYSASCQRFWPSLCAHCCTPQMPHTFGLRWTATELLHLPYQYCMGSPTLLIAIGGLCKAESAHYGTVSYVVQHT